LKNLIISGTFQNACSQAAATTTLAPGPVAAIQRSLRRRTQRRKQQQRPQQQQLWAQVLTFAHDVCWTVTKKKKKAPFFKWQWNRYNHDSINLVIEYLEENKIEQIPFSIICGPFRVLLFIFNYIFQIKYKYGL